MHHLPLPPHHQQNVLLNVRRLPQHLAAHYEIKDPSIIQTKEGQYQLYASVGNSVHQEWMIGRFIADTLTGPWTEIAPVSFDTLQGPQVCAPALRYEATDQGEKWTMYVQSCCFETDGYIALATSTDGQHFCAASQPLLTREMLGQHATDVIGLYDAGISQVSFNNQLHHCLVFSGYRRVGCGDVYMTYAPVSAAIPTWAPPQRILAQEDVPFHNQPDYEWFEWGLEGAQIVQLPDETFLMWGVCFMPKPDGHLGTRQRVFMSHAQSLLGPFVPMTIPIEPQPNSAGTGENGHPDAVICGDTLHLIYQERAGHGQPWYLRYAAFSLSDLITYTQRTYEEMMDVTGESPTAPNLPTEHMHLTM